MKYSQDLRRVLRKAALWMGSATTTMALRGCPCPAPVTVPSQNFTKSIAVSTGMLNAEMSSWNSFCEQSCTPPGSPPTSKTSCYVQVNTSEGNSEPASVHCGELSSIQGSSTGINLDKGPWVSACQEACGEEQDCRIGVDSGQNKVIIDCESWWENCAGGRGTEGVCAQTEFGELEGDALGISRMADLEAQSVPAFGRLRRELRAHGAARSLQRKASRSRRDEKRHTRMIGALAKRFGGKGAIVSKERPSIRSLEEMALENALEGCIRETFGAYVAHIQAEQAKDKEVRGILRRVAADETMHAGLAWEIHAWAMGRLGVEARERIAYRMKEAMGSFSWPKLVFSGLS